MNKIVLCRYCGKPFVPAKGKPGYINECLSCLYARSRPSVPKDFVARFESQFPKRIKALRALRKQLAEFGIDEELAFEGIAEALKRSGTQI